MKISILTLFPEMFQGPFDYSIIKNATEKKLIDIKLINIRDFGMGKHRVVDDTPYGGGSGMILRADVLINALNSVRRGGKEKTILLSASGAKYDHKKAIEYSRLDHLILICGHYEGIDDRIRNFVDEELSIGDYVLTGGEIPAMVITDSVARLVKGVLKEGVTDQESFSGAGSILEHPQYTKPRIVGKLKVPEILISGHHGKINEWKKENAALKTKKMRPDLYSNQKGKK